MKKLAVNKKKLTAAVAAVTAYIKTEEEAMMAMAASQADQKQPLVLPNHWGMSGRQTMMQHRNLMQLKAFHRVTPH